MVRRLIESRVEPNPLIEVAVDTNFLFRRIFYSWQFFRLLRNFPKKSFGSGILIFYRRGRTSVLGRSLNHEILSLARVWVWDTATVIGSESIGHRQDYTSLPKGGFFPRAILLWLVPSPTMG